VEEAPEAPALRRSTARSKQICVVRSPDLHEDPNQIIRCAAGAEGAACSAPDEFLSIHSPFNLISDPRVRRGCSAKPGGPSL
jgi:hypothetical protein